MPLISNVRDHNRDVAPLWTSMNNETQKQTPESTAPKDSSSTIGSDQALATAKKREAQPIAKCVEGFVLAIRGIGQTAQLVLPHTSKWLLAEMENVEKSLSRFVPGFPKVDKKSSIAISSAREFAEFTELLRNAEDLRSNRATSILARSLFMQMFSEFDAYMGSLLTAIYLKNDQLLKGISREISLTDLLEFETLDAVKQAMLEKEIDTFRRDSYVDQFATLEKKLSINLRKFKEWGEFVELGQRRNILTHNGGVVNDQYLSVCDREGFAFAERPKSGHPLHVDIRYFTRALRLISKVGLMLGYTLWGKVFPKECPAMQDALNDTLYQCLKQKRWHFVAELEDFVLSEPMLRGISEIDRRIRIVNVAIGLKFSDQSPNALKLLHSMDWSASYRDFKLAIAVLEDKFDEATKLMLSIGKSGEIISQTDYHTWPLFTKFREHPEFYSTYEQVYGEAFSEKVTTEAGPVEAVAAGSVALKSSGAKTDDVIDVEPKAIGSAKKNVASRTKRVVPGRKQSGSEKPQRGTR